MPTPDPSDRNYAKLLRHRFSKGLEKYRNKKIFSTAEAIDFLYTALSVRDAQAHLDYFDSGSPSNSVKEFCPFSQAELAFQRGVEQNNYWLNYSLEANYDTWTSDQSDRSGFDEVVRVCKIFNMKKRLAMVVAFDETFPIISEASERMHDSDEDFRSYRDLVERIELMPHESYEEAEEMILAYYQLHEDQFLNPLP
jgi:hypothetical protein